MEFRSILFLLVFLVPLMGPLSLQICTDTTEDIPTIVLQEEEQEDTYSSDIEGEKTLTVTSIKDLFNDLNDVFQQIIVGSQVPFLEPHYFEPLAPPPRIS